MKSFASFQNVIKHQQGFQSARKMLAKKQVSVEPYILQPIESLKIQLQDLEDSCEISSYCAYDSDLQYQCRISLLQEQIKQSKQDLQDKLKSISKIELMMNKLERNTDKILLSSYNTLKLK